MFEKFFGSGESGLVTSAFDDVTSMLRQSARMLDAAMPAVVDNQPLTVDLDSMDDVVDEGERMVRRTVLEHLSLNPEKDLVASLILVSMVQDVERVGDFARGLSELVPLAKSPRQGIFADDLRAIYRRVRPLFEMTEKAFREDDAAVANEVVRTQQEIKEELSRYTKAIADSDLSADMAVVYCSAARILRRIAAHLSNLCSSVVQPYDRIRHGDENA